MVKLLYEYERNETKGQPLEQRQSDKLHAQKAWLFGGLGGIVSAGKRPSKLGHGGYTTNIRYLFNIKATGRSDQPGNFSCNRLSLELLL